MSGISKEEYDLYNRWEPCIFGKVTREFMSLFNNRVGTLVLGGITAGTDINDRVISESDIEDIVYNAYQSARKLVATVYPDNYKTSCILKVKDNNVDTLGKLKHMFTDMVGSTPIVVDTDVEYTSITVKSDEVAELDRVYTLIKDTLSGTYYKRVLEYLKRDIDLYTRYFGNSSGLRIESRIVCDTSVYVSSVILSEKQDWLDSAFIGADKFVKQQEIMYKKEVNDGKGN